MPHIGITFWNQNLAAQKHEEISMNSEWSFLLTSNLSWIRIPKYARVSPKYFNTQLNVFNPY